MVKIVGSNYIAGYPPEQVFGVGICTENWPKDVEGLRIDPDGLELEKGSGVFVAIELPIIGLFEINNAEVTKFEVAESIIIKGGTKLAKVAVSITLFEDEECGGTRIDHGIEVSRGSKLIPLLIPDKVIRPCVGPKADEFARKLCQSNVRSLGGRSVSAATKSRRRRVAA